MNYTQKDVKLPFFVGYYSLYFVERKLKEMDNIGFPQYFYAAEY